MAKCVRCGREFDVSYARRSIGHSYGAGTYNEYYPEGDVCEYCATEELKSQIDELMRQYSDEEIDEDE